VFVFVEGMLREDTGAAEGCCSAFGHDGLAALCRDKNLVFRRGWKFNFARPIASLYAIKF
jgi:hypothetical protein